MTDSLIGQTLGKYTIIEKIGRGGMADVYKAYQENLDRYVAVKVMHSFLIDFEEDNFLRRFSREAKTMASLNHPHIVRVYDFDSFGPRSHYLVMDYVDGGSLKERLEALAAEGKRMPLAQNIKIITQIADALVYAHHRDMVHRDIKPANILLDKNEEPFLTDFGIVKMVGGQTMGYTVTGALIGTPAYMSPEQALGKPGDKRSDLYSLGIMLFQMVTGKLPFDADTPLGVAMKHVSEQVPLPARFNPDVPQMLQTIILQALAKEPNDRFQSAGEMAAALRQVDLSAEERPFTTPPPSIPTSPKTEILPPEPVEPLPLPADRTPPGGKRRWPLWAGLVLLLAALGVAAAVFLPRLNRSNQISTAPTAPPSSTPPPTDTAVPTITPTPEDTPDVVQTTIAVIVLTNEAGTKAAETAVPSSTATPAATSTLAATKTVAPTNTATPTATATATATRSGNTTGAAQTGGGLPNGFETFGVWVRGDEDNGTFTQSTERVHGGSFAGKLSYDFRTGDNDYVVFLQLNSISGTPNTLQIWVYGDGAGHFLNAWILDGAGETWQVPLGRITHTGWQQMTGYIVTGQDWPWGHISGPSNDKIDYPITFRAFVLDDLNNSYTGSGVIYLDDLTATTGDVSGISTTRP